MELFLHSIGRQIKKGMHLGNIITARAMRVKGRRERFIAH